MKVPTPVFSIQFVIYENGKVLKTVEAGGMLVTGFEMKIYAGLSSAETTIELFDPTFELASSLNVHEFISNDRHIICRYLFGHPTGTYIWNTPRGIEEGGEYWIYSRFCGFIST